MNQRASDRLEVIVYLLRARVQLFDLWFWKKTVAIAVIASLLITLPGPQGWAGPEQRFQNSINTSNTKPKSTPSPSASPSASTPLIMSGSMNGTVPTGMLPFSVYSAFAGPGEAYEAPYDDETNPAALAVKTAGFLAGRVAPQANELQKAVVHMTDPIVGTLLAQNAGRLSQKNDAEIGGQRLNALDGFILPGLGVGTLQTAERLLTDRPVTFGKRAAGSAPAVDDSSSSIPRWYDPLQTLERRPAVIRVPEPGRPGQHRVEYVGEIPANGELFGRKPQEFIEEALSGSKDGKEGVGGLKGAIQDQIKQAREAYRQNKFVEYEAEDNAAKVWDHIQRLEKEQREIADMHDGALAKEKRKLDRVREARKNWAMLSPSFYKSESWIEAKIKSLEKRLEQIREELWTGKQDAANRGERKGLYDQWNELEERQKKAHGLGDDFYGLIQKIAKPGGGFEDFLKDVGKLDRASMNAEAKQDYANELAKYNYNKINQDDEPKGLLERAKQLWNDHKGAIIGFTTGYLLPAAVTLAVTAASGGTLTLPYILSTVVGVGGIKQLGLRALWTVGRQLIGRRLVSATIGGLAGAVSDDGDYLKAVDDTKRDQHALRDFDGARDLSKQFEKKQDDQRVAAEDMNEWMAARARDGSAYHLLVALKGGYTIMDGARKELEKALELIRNTYEMKDPLKTVRVIGEILSGKRDSATPESGIDSVTAARLYALRSKWREAQEEHNRFVSVYNGYFSKTYQDKTYKDLEDNLKKARKEVADMMWRVFNDAQKKDQAALSLARAYMPAFDPNTGKLVSSKTFQNYTNYVANPNGGSDRWDDFAKTHTFHNFLAASENTYGGALRLNPLTAPAEAFRHALDPEYNPRTNSLVGDLTRALWQGTEAAVHSLSSVVMQPAKLLIGGTMMGFGKILGDTNAGKWLTLTGASTVGNTPILQVFGVNGVDLVKKAFNLKGHELVLRLGSDGQLTTGTNDAFVNAQLMDWREKLMNSPGGQYMADGAAVVGAIDTLRAAEFLGREGGADIAEGRSLLGAAKVGAALLTGGAQIWADMKTLGGLAKGFQPVPLTPGEAGYWVGRVGNALRSAGDFLFIKVPSAQFGMSIRDGFANIAKSIGALVNGDEKKRSRKEAYEDLFGGVTTVGSAFIGGTANRAGELAAKDIVFDLENKASSDPLTIRNFIGKGWGRAGAFAQNFAREFIPEVSKLSLQALGATLGGAPGAIGTMFAQGGFSQRFKVSATRYIHELKTSIENTGSPNGALLTRGFLGGDVVVQEARNSTEAGRLTLRPNLFYRLMGAEAVTDNFRDGVEQALYRLSQAEAQRSGVSDTASRPPSRGRFAEALSALRETWANPPVRERAWQPAFETGDGSWAGERGPGLFERGVSAMQAFGRTLLSGSSRGSSEIRSFIADGHVPIFVDVLNASNRGEREVEGLGSIGVDEVAAAERMAFWHGVLSPQAGEKISAADIARAIHAAAKGEGQGGRPDQIRVKVGDQTFEIRSGSIEGDLERALPLAHDVSHEQLLHMVLGRKVTFGEGNGAPQAGGSDSGTLRERALDRLVRIDRGGGDAAGELGRAISGLSSETEVQTIREMMANAGTDATFSSQAMAVQMQREKRKALEDPLGPEARELVKLKVEKEGKGDELSKEEKARLAKLSKEDPRLAEYEKALKQERRASQALGPASEREKALQQAKEEAEKDAAAAKERVDELDGGVRRIKEKELRIREKQSRKETLSEDEKLTEEEQGYLNEYDKAAARLREAEAKLEAFVNAPHDPDVQGAVHREAQKNRLTKVQVRAYAHELAETVARLERAEADAARLRARTDRSANEEENLKQAEGEVAKAQRALRLKFGIQGNKVPESVSEVVEEYRAARDRHAQFVPGKRLANRAPAVRSDAENQRAKSYERERNNLKTARARAKAAASEGRQSYWEREQAQARRVLARLEGAKIAESEVKSADRSNPRTERAEVLAEYAQATMEEAHALAMLARGHRTSREEGGIGRSDRIWSQADGLFREAMQHGKDATEVLRPTPSDPGNGVIEAKESLAKAKQAHERAPQENKEEHKKALDEAEKAYRSARLAEAAHERAKLDGQIDKEAEAKAQKDWERAKKGREPTQPNKRLRGLLEQKAQWADEVVTTQMKIDALKEDLAEGNHSADEEAVLRRRISEQERERDLARRIALGEDPLSPELIGLAAGAKADHLLAKKGVGRHGLRAVIRPIATISEAWDARAVRKEAGNQAVLDVASDENLNHMPAEVKTLSAPLRSMFGSEKPLVRQAWVRENGSDRARLEVTGEGAKDADAMALVAKFNYCLREAERLPGVDPFSQGQVRSLVLAVASMNTRVVKEGRGTFAVSGTGTAKTSILMPVADFMIRELYQEDVAGPGQKVRFIHVYGDDALRGQGHRGAGEKLRQLGFNVLELTKADFSRPGILHEIQEADAYFLTRQTLNELMMAYRAQGRKGSAEYEAMHIMSELGLLQRDESDTVRTVNLIQGKVAVRLQLVNLGVFNAALEVDAVMRHIKNEHYKKKSWAEFYERFANDWIDRENVSFKEKGPTGESFEDYYARMKAEQVAVKNRLDPQDEKTFEKVAGQFLSRRGQATRHEWMVLEMLPDALMAAYKNDNGFGFDPKSRYRVVPWGMDDVAPEQRYGDTSQAAVRQLIGARIGVERRAAEEGDPPPQADLNFVDNAEASLALAETTGISYVETSDTAAANLFRERGLGVIDWTGSKGAAQNREAFSLGYWLPHGLSDPEAIGKFEKGGAAEIKDGDVRIQRGMTEIAGYISDKGGSRRILVVTLEDKSIQGDDVRPIIDRFSDRIVLRKVGAQVIVYENGVEVNRGPFADIAKFFKEPETQLLYLREIEYKDGQPVKRPRALQPGEKVVVILDRPGSRGANIEMPFIKVGEAVELLRKSVSHGLDEADTVALRDAAIHEDPATSRLLFDEEGDLRVTVNREKVESRIRELRAAEILSRITQGKPVTERELNELTREGGLLQAAAAKADRNDREDVKTAVEALRSRLAGKDFSQGFLGMTEGEAESFKATVMSHANQVFYEVFRDYREQGPMYFTVVGERTTDDGASQAGGRRRGMGHMGRYGNQEMHWIYRGDKEDIEGGGVGRAEAMITRFKERGVEERRKAMYRGILNDLTEIVTMRFETMMRVAAARFERSREIVLARGRMPAEMVGRLLQGQTRLLELEERHREAERDGRRLTGDDRAERRRAQQEFDSRLGEVVRKGGFPAGAVDELVKANREVFAVGKAREQFRTHERVRNAILGKRVKEKAYDDLPQQVQAMIKNFKDATQDHAKHFGDVNARLVKSWRSEDSETAGTFRADSPVIFNGQLRQKDVGKSDKRWDQLSAHEQMEALKKETQKGAFLELSLKEAVGFLNRLDRRDLDFETDQPMRTIVARAEAQIAHIQSRLGGGRGDGYGSEAGGSGRDDGGPDGGGSSGGHRVSDTELVALGRLAIAASREGAGRPGRASSIVYQIATAFRLSKGSPQAVRAVLNNDPNPFGADSGITPTAYQPASRGLRIKGFVRAFQDGYDEVTTMSDPGFFRPFKAVGYGLAMAAQGQMTDEDLVKFAQAGFLESPPNDSARAGDLFGLAVAANPRAANSVLTEGQMVAAADRMADRLAVQEAQQNALPEGKTLEQRREDVRKTKRQEVLNSLMPFKIIALTAPRGRVVSGSGFVQFVSGTGANREVVLRIHRFTQEAGLAVAALTEFADKAKQSVRIEISAAPDADRDAVGIRGKIMDLVAPIDSAGVRRVPRPRMHLVDLSKADTQPSRMPLGLRALGVVSRLGSGAVTPALPMKELLKIVREESGIQSQIEQLQKRMAEAREDRDGGGAQEDVWKLFQKMQALSEKLTEVRAKRDKLLNEMRYAAIVLDAADQAGLLPATPGTAETAPGLLISSLAKAKDAQGAAEAVQTFWGAEPAERENTAAWTLGVEEGRGEPRIVNVNVPQNLAERAVQAVTNALSSAAADGRDWAGVVVAHFQRALRLAEKAGNKPKTMEEVQALAVEQLAPVRNNVASGSKDAADKAERAVTDLQTVIENAVNEAMNVALKEAVKAAFKKSEDDEASGGIVAELGKPIVLVVNGHAPSDGEKPLIQDLAAGILRKEYPEKPVPPIHLATADEVREYRKKIAEEHEARREEVVRNLKGSAVFDPRPDRQYVAQAVVTLGILAVVMFGVGMLVAGVPIVIGVATGKVAGLSGALIIAKANLTGFITTHIVTAAHATGRAAAHGTGATIVAWAKMWLVKSLATLPIGVGAHIARGRLLKATGFSDQSNPFQGSKDAGAMKTMGLNMLVSMGIGWGLVLAVNHALGAMTLGIGGWWMLSMITPLVVQPVTALGKKVWELYLEIRRFGIRSLFQRSRQSARTRRAAPTATRGSVFGRLMPWAPRLVGGGAVISLALLLLSRAQASPIVQSAVKHASSDAVQPTLASHVFHTAHQVREASGPNFWQNLLHNPKAILTMVLVIAAVAIVAYMVAAHFNDRNDPPTAGSGGGGPPEPPLPPDQTPSRRSLRRGPMSLTGAA